MKRLTREWVAKAEQDFAAAEDLARRQKVPLPDSVCFHCQQCVEKYLKARLQETGIPFPKTHSLWTLLDLLLPVEPGWKSFRPALKSLSIYAVDFRYPGTAATLAQARQSLAASRTFRKAARRSLGLF
jgi:HEPN domain-containing protein